MGKTELIILITVLGGGLLAALIIVIRSYIRSPFEYPYKEIYFDVTGTRNPNMNDYLDDYLIKNGMEPFDEHVREVAAWKKSCEEIIQKSRFKKRRRKQYEECIDDECEFILYFEREKTRYQQVNYVRHPYKVTETVEADTYDYVFIKNRYTQLEEINFECVLSSYHSKTQRNLMTKELRTQIAMRDNYTCQICGKYMPDGVGLHIDHIIPVSKGGKSVPSNLQVLCSKCNGHKSSK